MQVYITKDILDNHIRRATNESIELLQRIVTGSVDVLFLCDCGHSQYIEYDYEGNCEKCEECIPSIDYAIANSG